MHLTGTLIKWNTEKAFGFIAPNGGGDHVFIHKTAFANKRRVPQINDTISFDVVKGKEGKYQASGATYAGEKLAKNNGKQISKFSVYLSLLFLVGLILAVVTNHLPKNLLHIYLGLSLFTFLTYALDKIKAQRDAWRTKESTLHILSLIGGWPGAALAQQFLRHKSSKQQFRRAYWVTVVMNLAAFAWLSSSFGNKYLVVFG